MVISTTSAKGELGQAAAVGKLVEMGYNVLWPLATARYDLVAEKNGRFVRVQVKTIYSPPTATVLKVRLYSVPRSGLRRYTSAEIDAVLVYWPAKRRWFWVDMQLDSKGANQSGIYIRLTPTKNNTKKRVREASQYEV